MASNSQWVHAVIVNWPLTGFATLLTIGRYVIRYAYAQTLYWDDLAHFIALATLIAHGAVDMTLIDYKSTIASAKSHASPDQLLGMYQHLTVLNTLENCMEYLIFWEVKVAFLLFYKRLFSPSRAFNIVWWIVFVVTICLVWGPLGGVISGCAGQTTLQALEYCNGATGPTRDRNKKLIYTCAINVVTDLVIMALPFWMLHKLQMRTSQKVGLGLAFSVAIFTVALDLVRTVKAVVGTQDIYTILEVNFNVIVSCLPSYRALLRMDQRKSLQKKYRGPSGASSGNGDSSFAKRRRIQGRALSWFGQSGDGSHGSVLQSDHQHGPAVPLSALAQKTSVRKDPYAIESESSTSLVDKGTLDRVSVVEMAEEVSLEEPQEEAQMGVREIAR